MDSSIFMKSIYFVFTFVFLCFSSITHAIDLSPFIYEFNAKGPGTKHLFKVKNDSQEMKAIKITISTRDVALDGIETNKVVKNKFQIYPSQFIIKPGTTKGVRVRWVGEGNIQTELAYRLNVEQMPVNLNPQKSKSQMQVLQKLVGAIYVVPVDGKASLAIGNVKSVLDENDKKLLSFEIQNKGNKHSNLKSHIINFNTSELAQLAPHHLEKYKSLYLPANQAREFVIPWPEELGGVLPKMSIE